MKLIASGVISHRKIKWRSLSVGFPWTSNNAKPSFPPLLKQVKCRMPCTFCEHVLSYQCLLWNNSRNMFTLILFVLCSSNVEFLKWDFKVVSLRPKNLLRKKQFKTKTERQKQNRVKTRWKARWKDSDTSWEWDGIWEEGVWRNKWQKCQQ